MGKEELKKEILGTMKRNKYIGKLRDCSLAELKIVLSCRVDDGTLYDTLLELRKEGKIGCSGTKVGNELGVSMWYLKSYKESLKDQFNKAAEKGNLEQLTVKYYKEINNIVYADEHIADKNMDKLKDIQKDVIEALTKYSEVKAKENKELNNILKGKEA